MKMKTRMVIMMRRAVVGLQNLLSPASEKPQCSNRLSPSVVSKRNALSKKHAPQMEARICIKMFETMQHMYDDDKDDDEDDDVVDDDDDDDDVDAAIDGDGDDDDDEEENDEEDEDEDDDEDEDGDGDGG